MKEYTIYLFQLWCQWYRKEGCATNFKINDETGWMGEVAEKGEVVETGEINSKGKEIEEINPQVLTTIGPGC